MQDLNDLLRKPLLSQAEATQLTEEGQRQFWFFLQQCMAHWPLYICGMMSHEALMEEQEAVKEMSGLLNTFCAKIQARVTALEGP